VSLLTPGLGFLVEPHPSESSIYMQHAHIHIRFVLFRFVEPYFFCPYFFCRNKFMYKSMYGTFSAAEDLPKRDVIMCAVEMESIYIQDHRISTTYVLYQ
jgi:hypothetical protein